MIRRDRYRIIGDRDKIIGDRNRISGDMKIVGQTGTSLKETQI